jgi:hypothetical protein
VFVQHETRAGAFARGSAGWPLAPGGCADTTTRRAAALGYPVVWVADAHTTTDKLHLAAPAISAHHNHTLSNITSFGPRIRAAPAVELVFGAG